MTHFLQELKRELLFSLRQKNVKILLVFGFLISVFSVVTGLMEINKQQATIERLVEYDQADREHVLKKYDEYGNLAYYTRHLTYSPPSELAFSAIGQRDVLPWKHRVRMLALEGQIYETDSDNPELAYVGRIDFAFLISILAPLFVILLLHDVRASERAGGRYDLLLTTSKHPERLWLTRILVGVLSLSVALLTPFIIGSIISGANGLDVLLVLAISVAQLIFWAAICYWVGKIDASAPQLASMLLGLWLATTIVVPVIGAKAIEASIHSPSGGDIVMTQREAVNGAWDKPFEDTFTPFLETHPEWRDYTKMNASFEWKWYYAFQQVGDLTAQPLSEEYRHARLLQNERASLIAWLSPAMLVQRSMTQIAQTDTLSMMAYEQSIRDFHARLRHFYYPFLFKASAFDKKQIEQRPSYSPDKIKNSKETL
ncbi:DUF3526 domain-containing protein [Psychrosphaera haliotis]|uniref:DUF3526 domain-containing protein n=1 Tax=Psychrosphaera haliotis TaxID=555083 RepID=A0A6N8F8E7_9GAMM|nr:DUF3526 domain-containing protein [Psychrosphaera haliotis]MUH72816.1 DUF3526 domain-containing protein [Psychrosphaera haliotis]